MAPRRKSTQAQVEEQVDWTPKSEEKQQAPDLRASLDKIKSRDDIVGYIIRGPTSASVDIKDPTKIIDYAALSGEAAEACEIISETFGLGKISNIVLEGESIKILSFSKDDQQVSIFMEKKVDHERLRKEV